MFFSILHLLLSQKVKSYDPVDNLAVNCGNKGNTNPRNRNWVGDVDSNTILFSLIEQSSVEANAPTPIPPNVEQIPFDSARLSQSQFTYSFHVVTNGPKFLRLHFYPTWYANFVPYNSLFSVKAGNFTLLKDFNASLWVDDKHQTITKEYCINIDSGERLNVSFLPTTSHSDVYAFINGIEIVSMPAFLYYTNLTNDLDPGKFKVVGHGTTPYRILSGQALDTVYRVNVGEKQVPPGEDTGMFRNWEVDYPGYLMKEYPQSISSDYTRQPIYKDNVAPNYTAPANVYLDARSYGRDATEDYNVTWEFQVDS
ncbi:hypothetical protein RJT34_18404 [Clitoria ternatea]|uniref:Malectin-like domain-containing protein n=1 Tax=Clitoria ternatea TaxID=43366 RepID=A0AAN9JDV7_CLITE